MSFFTKICHVPQAIKKPSTFTGLWLAMASGVIFSTIGAIVKMVSNIHPGQLAAYRFAAGFVFSLPEAIARQENLLGPKQLRSPLLFVGIVGAATIFLNFVAFQSLPLGEAAVIILSLPVFVSFAARIFLKEPFGIVQSINVLLSFLGILFTAQIPEKLSSNNWVYTTGEIYGLLASVGSLACNTSVYIVMRQLKILNHSVILVNTGLVGSVITVLVTFIVGDFKLHHCGVEQVYIITLIFLSYLGMTLLTIALRCEHAGPVSTLRAAADISVSFLWQICFFQHHPSVFGVLGAFLVTLSVIFVGLRKYVISMNQDSKCLSYMTWITM